LCLPKIFHVLLLMRERRSYGPAPPTKREITMAETTKLSVEKALKKIRDTDPPEKATRTDRIDELEKETERLRAQRLRLERHQRGKR
jgi:hypothetical protein